MDFSWTEEQKALRERIKRFVGDELTADVAALDAAGTFDHDGWTKLGELGIQGLPVPKAYGGSEADAITIVGALEALGEACRDNGLLFALNAHLWAVEIPVLGLGSDEQKKRWLPGLVSGELIGAFCSAEPSAGSDAFSLRTTATPTDDGFVLDGQKTWITNGPIADLLLVIAREPGTKGTTGLVGMLVEADTPGVTISEIEKLGIRTSPMAEVHFSDCHVPAEAVLDKPGGGMAIFNEAMGWERAFILATAVGTMQRQLTESTRALKDRRRGGLDAEEFKALSARLVDMKVRLESARMLLYRVAWIKDQGRHIMVDAALTKYVISEAWVANSQDAIQVRGEAGLTVEAGAERDLRDAMGSRIYSGTSEIQRMIVGQGLGV